MYDALYERGIAVGHSDIKTDTMSFTFRDENFTFPTIKAYPLAQYNGYFYVAPIDKLRELERDTATG